MGKVLVASSIRQQKQANQRSTQKISPNNYSSSLSFHTKLKLTVLSLVENHQGIKP